jgi:hypothetical protein
LWGKRRCNIGFMARGPKLWIPLLFVGSALYWSAALGLGALSLSLMDGGEELDQVTEEIAIPVQLMRKEAAGVTVPVTVEEPDEQSVPDGTLPGRTAY